MNQISRGDAEQETPTGNTYVYHLTDERNLDSILGQGIDSNYKSEKWTKVNEFIREIGTREQCNPLPQKRENCVFTYPRFADGIDSLYDGNSMIVIDLSKVSSPCFRGSYQTVTDIYDIIENKNNSVGEIIESRVVDKSAEEAYVLAKDYLESLEQISNGTSKGGEVLISGPVSPSAITHYVR